jgi:hypothetical protein
MCALTLSLSRASYRIVSHRIASHRIASHRIASHRIASHRIASHEPQGVFDTKSLELFRLRSAEQTATNFYRLDGVTIIRDGNRWVCHLFVQCPL